MSRLPSPLYVPGAMMIVSPLTAASIAACIVGYSLGTSRSLPEEIEAEIRKPAATNKLASRVAICILSFNEEPPNRKVPHVIPV
jgi:hypothetical protein